MFDGKDEEFRRPLSAIRETSATETKNLNKGRLKLILPYVTYDMLYNMLIYLIIK